jgi:hypothetical protein
MLAHGVCSGACQSLRNKLRTVCGGTKEYFEITKGLPHGPKNLEELCNPHIYLAQRIFAGKLGHVLLQRTMSHAQSGVAFMSEFTCRQGQELMMAIHQVTMERYGLPSGWLTFWRGSEPLEHLQQLMRTGGVRSEHVFPTCESVHLNASHMAGLRNLRPVAGDTAAEASAMAKKQREYIEHHHEEIYDDAAVSYNCVNHPKQPCRVRWSDERVGINRMTSMMFGTPLCRPYCPDGNKLGAKHPGEEGHICHLGELKYSNVDQGWTENSHLYPAKEYVKELSSVHRTAKYILCAPFDIGFPVGGERFLGLHLEPSDKGLGWGCRRRLHNQLS